MELQVNRIFLGVNYTIGKFMIDGKYFCDTIEDAVRKLPDKCPTTIFGAPCKCKEKIQSKTAIPSGTYKVTVGMSPRFKRKLPIIMNVPHFLGILIHNGTSEESSSGCIILGENKVKGKVQNGTKYMNELTDLLINEMSQGNPITITIK